LFQQRIPERIQFRRWRWRRLVPDIWHSQSPTDTDKIRCYTSNARISV
jgi:hypothetical protein